MKRVTLRQILFEKCPHLGCIHNEKGMCVCELDDFIIRFAEIIRDYVNEDGLIELDTEFNCLEARAKDGYCLDCGGEIISWREPHKIDGWTWYEEFCGCTNCDK